ARTDNTAQKKSEYIEWPLPKLISILKTRAAEASLTEEHIDKLSDYLFNLYDIRFQPKVDAIKELYMYFNPDTAYNLPSLSETDMKEKEKSFSQCLYELLDDADYTRITTDELKEALYKEGVLPMSFNVNWEYFEWVKLYYQGKGQAPEKLDHPLIPLLKNKKMVEVYEKFILIFKYKDEEYFKKKKIKLKGKPGKIYLKFLINVPCYDMEMVFPSAMPRIDYLNKAKIVIPLLTCLGTIFYKYGLYPLFYYNQLPYYSTFEKVTKFDDPPVSIISAGLLSLLVILGTYSFKVYSNYKQTVQDILAKVTSTLYFKNIISNLAVIITLIRNAEEECVKKALLVYVILSCAKKGMTPEEIDNEVERWLFKNYEMDINFDIDDIMKDLDEMGLVQRSKDGKLLPRPINELIPHLHKIWKNAVKR
ncbi:MAG: DUF3754 domain-containing protein, partial [Thermoplasmata archaeon]